MTESAVFYEPRRGFLPPGSDKARSVGCRCAVIDNNHGRFPVQPPTDAFPDGVWWINSECPIHAGAGVRRQTECASSPPPDGGRP